MNKKLKIFTDIQELLTLRDAFANRGRRVSEADLSIVQNAAMAIEDGRVVWVGEQKLLQKDRWKDAELTSLNGATVLPGFVESHTHLVFAGDRSHEFEWRVQGKTYQQIAAQGGGILHTVKQTRAASFEQLLILAQNRANRYLRQGVTTLEVKSGYGLNVETEVKCLKVARAIQGPRIVTTFLGAHSRSPDFDDLDSYMDSLIQQALPQIKHQGLADRVDIYIEKGFFTVEQGRRYFTRAKELGLPITAHVEQLSQFGGTKLALEFNPQSVDHVVFATDADIQTMAKMDTTAVLLPASDFYLKMAYPRAREMIDAGVRVAVSTDFNPGTSPTQDLSLVGLLSRLEMKMSLPEVIAGFTVGAAFALGRAAEIGSLTEGKLADFVVLEGGWRELFVSVGNHPIKQVYLSGEKSALFA